MKPSLIRDVTRVVRDFPNGRGTITDVQRALPAYSRNKLQKALTDAACVRLLMKGEDGALDVWGPVPEWERKAKEPSKQPDPFVPQTRWVKVPPHSVGVS